jgi:hypothetical protein
MKEAGVSNKEMGFANIHAILKSLAITGWARAEDLVHWTQPLPFGEDRAEIIRRNLLRLAHEELVSTHELPSRFGTAFRLSEKGIRFCRGVDIETSWKGHPMPAIGPRFHEHLIALNVLGMFGPDQCHCNFARDIKWAKKVKENDEEIKLLKNGVRLIEPRKEVDAFVYTSLIDESGRPRPVRYYIEIEWSRKTGPKMARQIISMERKLVSEKSAVYVLVYPKAPEWQRDVMRKMGKTEEIINHRTRLLNYMKRRRRLVENHDRILFLELDISGNFHFAPSHFVTGLTKEKARLDAATAVIEADWTEEEVYFDSKLNESHGIYTHAPSGASFILVREFEGEARKRGWYKQTNYQIASLDGVLPEFKSSGEVFIPFSKDYPSESWQSMVKRTQREILVTMYFDHQCVFNEWREG